MLTLKSGSLVCLSPFTSQALSLASFCPATWLPSQTITHAYPGHNANGLRDVPRLLDMFIDYRCFLYVNVSSPLTRLQRCLAD